MKKVIFLLLSVLTTFNLLAQVCKIDSSILQMPPDVILLPLPYDAATNPDTTSPPACINEPYEMFATLRVPETFTYLGNTLPLDSVVIVNVVDLPLGLTYSCDPITCSFKKNTLGCIRVYGTPTAANAIKAYSIGIKLKAFTSLLPGVGIDLSFPLNTSQAFFIRVRATGQCVASDSDLPASISNLTALPNPTSGSTTILVNAIEKDDFNFEVFDMTGRRMRQSFLNVVPGENRFDFNASSLPVGIYVYTLSNAKGKISRRLVVK